MKWFLQKTLEVLYTPLHIRHFRFRFGLRTLFVLVSVFCVWLGFSANWIRERRALRKAAYAACGFVESEKADAPFGLWLFGERGMATIYFDRADASTIRRFSRAFPEAYIQHLVRDEKERPAH